MDLRETPTSRPRFRITLLAAVVTCAVALAGSGLATVSDDSSNAAAAIPNAKLFASADSDFTSIFTPRLTLPVPVKAPSVQLAAAFAALNTLLGRETRFGEAVIGMRVSLDRAEAADSAGAQLWLVRQANASAEFALAASRLVASFPALQAAMVKAFVADKMTLTLTPAQFAAAKAKLLRGLPASFTHLLIVAAAAYEPSTVPEVAALKAAIVDTKPIEQALAHIAPKTLVLPAVLASSSLTAPEVRLAAALKGYADTILQPVPPSALGGAARGLEPDARFVADGEEKPTLGEALRETLHLATDAAEASVDGAKASGEAGAEAAEALEPLAKGLGYAFAAVAFQEANAAFDQSAGAGGGEGGSAASSGLTWGDPHVVTLKGFHYDFQGAGEFTLVRSDDGSLDIQVRQQPQLALSDEVSFDTAVAMLVAGTRVEVDPGLALGVLVDGHPVQLNEAADHLHGGGELYYDPVGDVVVKWPDGSKAVVYDAGIGGYVVFTAAPDLAGKLKGLLTAVAEPEGAPGIPDGDEVLIGGNGKRYVVNALATAPSRTLYREFAPTWQITQQESLFTYPPGKSTSSYILKNFPGSGYNLASVPPGRLTDIKNTCREAGVTNANLLEDCVYDSAATGRPAGVVAALAARTETVVTAAEHGGITSPTGPPQVAAGAVSFGEASNVSFAGHSGTVLAGASCPTGPTCVAVGQDMGNYARANGTIVVSETATGWRTAPAPVASPPPTHGADSLSSVSCPAAGTCTAVGAYRGTNNGTLPLVETGTGSAWQPASTVALPVGANGSAVLNGVSCTKAGTCLAVGTYGDHAFTTHAMAVLSTGGQWGQSAQAVEIELPPGANASETPDLSAVSCAGTGCLAVGEYGQAFYVHPGMAVAESGGQFQRAVEVKPPASSPGFVETTLTGVSCTGPATCAISGTYPNPKTDVGSAMVASEVDGAWRPSVYIEPPVGINSTLSGVSCVSAGNCVAVGSYVDSAGVTVPMYVDETDGHWAQAVEIAIPAGDSGASLDGVACSPGGACAAVGTAHNGDGIVALSTAATS